MGTGFASTRWAQVGGWTAALVLALQVASGPAAAQSLPAASLPPNLIVPEIVRPLLESMWLQSVTFRRQCARLSEHRKVLVRLELVTAVRRTSGARSLIRRHPGGLDAAVEVEFRKPAMLMEHIAHELEHVLEHVDGANLRTLADQGVGGVIASGERYETARAIAAGRAVAREAVTR